MPLSETSARFKYRMDTHTHIARTHTHTHTQPTMLKKKKNGSMCKAQKWQRKQKVIIIRPNVGIDWAFLHLSAL